MAGSLIISKDRFWGPATWVFTGVLRLARVYLPTNEIPALARRIDAGTEEGSGFYISLEDVPLAEVKVFLAALESGYQAAEASGAAVFHSPEFYPTLIDEYRNLIREVAGRLDEEALRASSGS